MTKPKSKITNKQLEKFYSMLSFKLFKWQKDAIWNYYKTDKKEFFLIAPRQNGKSQILLVIVLIELFIFGKTITFTSHRVDACEQFFNKVKRELTKNEDFMEFVLKLNNAKGSQMVELFDGGKITFLARTKDGGIGDSNDMIIFDECQMINTKQMSAIFPTLAAMPDSKTIYAGTSPRVIDDDSFYRSQRESHFGKDTWCEYGIGEQYDLDYLRKNNLFLSKDLIKKTNPSFSKMIEYDAVVREFGVMDELDYAIQRLGLLHSTQQKMVFNEAMLNKVLINGKESQKYKGDFILGIKFGTDYHCAVIGTKKNGETYLQVLDKRENANGFEWLAEYILENKNCIGVTVDGLYSKAFAPMISKKFYKTYNIIGSREFIAAENILEQEIMSARLKISDQESIREELQNVRWLEKTDYSKFAPLEDGSEVVVAEAMAIANHFVKQRKWR